MNTGPDDASRGRTDAITIGGPGATYLSNLLAGWPSSWFPSGLAAALASSPPDRTGSLAARTPGAADDPLYLPAPDVPFQYPGPYTSASDDGASHDSTLSGLLKAVRDLPPSWVGAGGNASSSPALPLFCQLENGREIPYQDLGNGFGMGGAPADLMPGVGFGVGQAVNDTAMPTTYKPGGIAGGGSSGKATSPASGILRNMTAESHYAPLRSVAPTSSVGGAMARALPLPGTALMLLDYLNGMKALQSAPICVPRA